MLDAHIRSHSRHPRPGRRLRRPRPARVHRHEALGEDDQVRATIGGLAEQIDRLVDGRIGVEDHRRRLDRRDPHRLESSHASDANETRHADSTHPDSDG